MPDAYEYLSNIRGTEESLHSAAPNLNPTISREAHQWKCIGQNVLANPNRFREVAEEIEMRLVYRDTVPGTGVLKPEKLRKAITWGYLGEVSQSAHQSVIRLEQTNDIGRIAESFGLDPHRVLSTQLLVNKCISTDVRAEMRSQFNWVKRQCAANPEMEARRMTALTDLVQELRSVHELSWLKHMQADDKINLFAFIAVGALQPWAATTFRNWHVLLSDVERLSRRLQGQPFPQRQGKMGDAYVVDFTQIFSERAVPSAWLGLSAREVRDRVEKLVRACEYPINSPDGIGERMALPVGFSAFLANGRVSVCGAPQGSGVLEELVLVSQSWEAAVQGLTQACLQAQANFARLADWQRTSADIAWKYLTDIRAGTPAAEAMKRANEELTEDGTFCRKALCLAIGRHEAPCVLH